MVGSGSVVILHGMVAGDGRWYSLSIDGTVDGVRSLFSGIPNGIWW